MGDEPQAWNNEAVQLLGVPQAAAHWENLYPAVAVLPPAVPDTPIGHPDRPMYLSNLGAALRERQERTDVPGYEDLDEAVELGRAAMAATPIDDPERARRLCGLSYSLQDRFARSRSSNDLNEAI